MTVSFSDLPLDVVGKVVRKVNLRDCLALRKVSRDLRNLVNTSEINCDKINFEFRDTYWRIESEDLTLRYDATEDGGCEVIFFLPDTSQSKTYRDDRNFKQIMLTDASTFLKNPKLKIGGIDLDTDSIEAAAEFFEFLKSLKSPINVRSIQSRDMYSLHSMVPLLKQKTLEDIIFTERGFNVDEFNELAKTDVLALLENPRLKIKSMHFEHYSDESSSKFWEILKSSDNQLRFGTIQISGRHEEWMTPALRFLNPEKVEEIMFLCCEFTIDRFNEFAGMEQWKKRTALSYCHFSGMGIEKLVDFKQIIFYNSPNENTDEELIKIRDILLKSPYLQMCHLILHTHHNTEEDMYKQLDAIMSQGPAYDAETHRVSIPNSTDYFQLTLIGPRDTEKKMNLLIWRNNSKI